MGSSTVNEDPFPTSLKYKVSSSYLAILQRHLSLVEPKLAKVLTEAEHASPSQQYTVDISSVSSALRQLEAYLGRANFGLDIGRNMHPSDYGIFGYAMMNCETLYQALETAAQHKTILNQKLFAAFIEQDDSVIYRVNTDINTRDSHILIELDFSTAFEFARRLAGPVGHFQLTSVHFAHAPLGPESQYEECFKCPVRFNAGKNEILVAKAELEQAIYGANPKVLSALEDKIKKVSSIYENQLTLQQRVMHFIAKNLCQELPSAVDAASSFNMSLSTFKKRLSDEGTCYQNICDAVRYQKCLELIRRNRSAIKEIAFELGFSNASAFNRAFKKWTGQSPTEYRKQQSGG